jgi:RNA methyltransferase, TrmH family
MATDPHISKPKLKFAKSLSMKKVRAEESLFVVEGWRAIEEACSSGIRAEMFLHTPAATASGQHAHVFESARRMARESFEASEQEISAVAETVTTQGVVLVLRQFDHTLEHVLSAANGAKPRIIVALDRISEPGNAGTIIRTADWFGADAVLLSEECVDIYNPKVVRSTMGSIFHLPVIESGGADGCSFIESLAACSNAGYTVYGADVNAQTDIRNVTWAEKSVIIIGNEAHGLSESVKAHIDETITIPKFGKAESLNAGTAAAVILGSMRL